MCMRARQRLLLSACAPCPHHATSIPCPSRSHPLQRSACALHHALRRFSSNNSPPPTLSDLKAAQQRLAHRIGREADLELWWMAERVTKQPVIALRSRYRSFAALLSVLPDEERASLHRLIAMRADGQPLQYVLGDTMFCALRLHCRAPTLIPRPETEQMTAWLIHVLRRCESSTSPVPWLAQSSAEWWPAQAPFDVCDQYAPQPRDAWPRLRILDACTGSGCIAVALAAHLVCSTVGVDVADSALHLARDNVSLAFSRLSPFRLPTFLPHDLFSASPSFLDSPSCPPFDVLVANPPYVPTSTVDTLQVEVKDHEDHRALDGGDDGLRFYPVLLDLASRVVRKDELRGRPEVVLEIGEGQATAVLRMCKKAGFSDARAFHDYSGKKRWIAAKRKK